MPRTCDIVGIDQGISTGYFHLVYKEARGSEGPHNFIQRTYAKKHLPSLYKDIKAHTNRDNTFIVVEDYSIIPGKRIKHHKEPLLIQGHIGGLVHYTPGEATFIVQQPLQRRVATKSVVNKIMGQEIKFDNTHTFDAARHAVAFMLVHDAAPKWVKEL